MHWGRVDITIEPAPNKVSFPVSFFFFFPMVYCLLPIFSPPFSLFLSCKNLLFQFFNFFFLLDFFFPFHIFFSLHSSRIFLFFQFYNFSSLFTNSDLLVFPFPLFIFFISSSLLPFSFIIANTLLKGFVIPSFSNLAFHPLQNLTQSDFPLHFISPDLFPSLIVIWKFGTLKHCQIKVCLEAASWLGI